MIATEENANTFPSDSRSGSIVDDRIRPTLESGSAIGSTKPVLLVIDEIDGATGAGDNVRKKYIFILGSLTFPISLTRSYINLFN